MTSWRQIADSGFSVPGGAADLDVLARELADALADPDPAVRDGPAYSVLTTWISTGVLDEQLPWLGSAMAARFTDDHVQARTFAPLVLAWVVERGGFEQGWVDAFERWYPAEADLRGYDSELGWLHAVAHGADLLGVLGAAGEPGPVPPSASNTMRTLRMLYLLADRGVRPEPGAAPLLPTHREAVLGELVETLALVAWFAG